MKNKYILPILGILFLIVVASTLYYFVFPKSGEISHPSEISSPKEHDFTRVIVSLKGNEFTSPDFRDDDKKKEEVKKIQERVLATLTEKDVRDINMFNFIPAFACDISQSGRERLKKNKDVLSIEEDAPDFPLRP